LDYLRSDVLSLCRRTYRSLINVLQLGLALLWAYVVFFKTISFGLLAWSVDQPVNVSACNLKLPLAESNESIAGPAPL
jgi:hypothetical protein